MRERIKSIIDGKTLLILGFGREGKSTYKLIRRYFPNKNLTISDKNSELLKENEFLASDDKLSLICGENYLNTINTFDLIIKSPGISFKDVEIKNKETVSSQTDIFMRLFAKQVIGITGTKGKSTTSSLLFEILSAYNHDTVLIGNIGLPSFEIADKISENTIIIYELSSHQLEYISVAPAISVLLNIFQEHLDHYKSYEDYQLAKFNIASKQNKENSFIFNEDDKLIKHLMNNYEIKSKQYGFSVTHESDCFIQNNILSYRQNEQIEEIFDLSNTLRLKGEHNYKNIMAAVVCCKIVGVPNELINEKILSFKGLPHRLELLETNSSIKFYNDSIATIPEATIEAVRTLGNVDTLILGGYDRGIDYSHLVSFIGKADIKNIILLGKVGELLMTELQKLDNLKSLLFLTNNFSEIGRLIKNNTKAGSVCLLSPAASSYDMFKNFEHRGDMFKKIVGKLL